MRAGTKDKRGKITECISKTFGFDHPPASYNRRISSTYRVVQKGWKHLFSVPLKNRWRDLRNIMETCVLFHGNFFDIGLDNVRSILLQSETTKQCTCFSPVYSFAKNLYYAGFELYVNPGDANTQHLFIVSGIGNMLLHKWRNTLWLRWATGFIRSVRFHESSSKTATAIGIALTQLRNASFGDEPIGNMTRIFVLCCFNKTSYVSEPVKGTRWKGISSSARFPVVQTMLSRWVPDSWTSRLCFQESGELSNRVTQPLKAC